MQMANVAFDKVKVPRVSGREVSLLVPRVIRNGVDHADRAAADHLFLFLEGGPHSSARAPRPSKPLISSSSLS